MINKILAITKIKNSFIAEEGYTLIDTDYSSMELRILADLSKDPLWLDIYKKDVNPDVKVLFWNLEGYSGGSPIDLEKTSEVFEISGFSDKLLEIAPKLWKDKDFLIKEIDNISL